SPLALADVDGDGHLDLVATDVATPPDAALTVLLGQGDGTFGVARDYLPDASQPFQLAFGDLDGDGHPDLVISRDLPDGTGVVQILSGDGAGGFQSPRSVGSGFYSSVGVLVADADGDGRLDLLLASASVPGLGFLRGNGDGTFQDLRVASTFAGFG